MAVENRFGFAVGMLGGAMVTMGDFGGGTGTVCC